MLEELMDKINILQFPIANTSGGITNYVLNNWRHIDRDRFHFDFATFSKKKLDFEETLTSQGCKVHYLSCYAEENEERFIEEMNHILEEGYDVIHLHTSYWKSFLAEKLALRHRVPRIIVHAHSTMVDKADEKERLIAIRHHQEQKKLFHRGLATDYWACSEAAADWLFGEQIPRERIILMRNAIDVRKFAFNLVLRRNYRQRLGLNDCLVLGHVGRFVHTKNHEFLIEVFRRVVSVYPQARLVLAGVGPMEEQIRQQVNDFGLGSSVIFLGAREDVHGIMQAMDLFLLPSHFEGLGIVLIEAQAAGLHCLASDKVPYEAKITGNLDFLPLKEEAWYAWVRQNAEKYHRGQTEEPITAAGYNIVSEIKRLEEGYGRS